MSFVRYYFSKVLILFFLVFLSSCSLLEEEKIEAKRNLWFENNVQQLDQLFVADSTVLGDSLKSWLSTKERFLNQYEPFCALVNKPNEAVYQVEFIQKTLAKKVYEINRKANKIEVSYTNKSILLAQKFDFLNDLKKTCHELFINQRKNTLLQSGYLKKEFEELNKYHPWSLKLPDDFKIVRHKENFLWIRTETVSQHSHILIHKAPYVSDEQFALSSLIKLRDSLAQRNILYRKNDSTTYMETEFYFPVTSETISIEGFYVKRTEGAWTIRKKTKKGIALGGLYIGYALVDATAPKDFYYLEAFFSAPNVNKLPFIRTLEAILKTFQLNRTDYEQRY